jgi:hypothetical protein
MPHSSSLFTTKEMKWARTCDMCVSGLERVTRVNSSTVVFHRTRGRACRGRACKPRLVKWREQRTRASHVHQLSCARKKIPVNAIDRGALMISSQHEKILGVLDFVREEEANALQTLRSAVYIVAEEQIVGVWREAAVLKQPQQVRVSTDIHPSIHNKKNTMHVKILNNWNGRHYYWV